MDIQKQRRPFPFLVLIIGILIGGLLAGAFFFFQAKQKANSPITETKGLLLSITSPSANQVSTSETVKVTGTTGKDSIVALMGPAETQITKTTNGSFSASLKLDPGENQVVVYAVDTSNGESVQTTLSLLYISSDMVSRNVLVAAENTAEPSDEQIEELKKKLATSSADLQAQNVKFKNSHVVGTVLSSNSTAITISLLNGRVQTIFIDDLTKSLVVGSSISTINPIDLKAGNRVAVTGLSTEDTNGYSNYVIRLEKTPPSLQAVAGKLKDRTDASIFLTSLADSDKGYTVNYDKDTKTLDKNGKEMDLADVKTDDFLVAAGIVEKEGSVTAKKLFVISAAPKSATGSSTTQD